MSIRAAVNEAIKDATKSRDHIRLECLRLAKAALLLKEKAGPKDNEISDADAIVALRGEVKKRRDSIETFKQLGKTDEVEKIHAEIAVLDEFLPKQLSEADLEAKIRAYLAEHPEVNHAGKLTGAIKKDLGDLADGKMLADLCKKVLEG
nr:LporfX [uncultured bacterium]